MNDSLLMSKDTIIAKIINDKLIPMEENLLPIYLQRTENIEEWLKQRAIDAHRTNSRLLKRALRLKETDDISTSLYFNASTITDTYWIKPIDSNLSYKDIKFDKNYFGKLALKGDVNSFNQPISRTPELTNIGSYEKCWELDNGEWWLYKQGTDLEYYSEMFAYKLASHLEIPVAHYEIKNDLIRTKDFTNSASVNLEPAYSLIGQKADSLEIFDLLNDYNSSLIDDYIMMLYFDALIFNMDRHEYNWGFLRDVDTGEVLNLAPLFDHNISLIARGYLKNITRKNDFLINDFTKLIKQRNIKFKAPYISTADIKEIINNMEIKLEPTTEITSPKDYVFKFINNGQQQIQKRLELEKEKEFER